MRGQVDCMDHLSLRVRSLPPTPPAQATLALGVNIFNHQNPFLSHFLDFIASFAPFWPLDVLGLEQESE